MEAAARLFGFGTAAAGTLLQLAVIAATFPRWRECAYGSCIGGHGEPPVITDIWRPFIDNIYEGEATAERERRCPSPMGRDGRYGIVSAPLPDGYDPHSFAGNAIIACVLVTRYGQVRTVRILRGTRRTVLDRSLTETIAGTWRFEADSADPRPLSWQRVRLSSGTSEPGNW
jgi:hypothetical protein